MIGIGVVVGFLLIILITMINTLHRIKTGKSTIYSRQKRRQWFESYGYMPPHKAFKDCRYHPELDDQHHIKEQVDRERQEYRESDDYKASITGIEALDDALFGQVR